MAHREDAPCVGARPSPRRARGSPFLHLHRPREAPARRSAPASCESASPPGEGSGSPRGLPSLAALRLVVFRGFSPSLAVRTR